MAPSSCVIFLHYSVGRRLPRRSKCACVIRAVPNKSLLPYYVALWLVQIHIRPTSTGGISLRATVKLATSTFTSTPPPLAASSGQRSPSVESVSTPTFATGLPFPSHSSNTLKRARENEPFFHWHKNAAEGHASVDDFTSDDLLFPHDDDDEDELLPLFPTATPLPHISISAMPTASPAIDIGTSRQSSSSPRTQQSALTSQIRQSNSQERADSSMGAPALPDNNGLDVRNRQESVSMLGTTPYGARQIPSGARLDRRESQYNMSNSLIGGMSWGGISMGSFIRDE